ncbi:MAG: phosphotransferase family protein [Gammaproteobacteria bacterium]|nr:phosphotransferase family protein [Gammaproteobacteria bacterium]
MNSDSGSPVLVEVRESHGFDIARLDAWLSDRLDGFGRGVRVRQYEGGQSNPTFLVESATRRVVLRKKPPGVLLPTAHQVEREYRILAALAGSEVPVPDVLALCEDESVIGTTFYVMAHVDGRVLSDPRLPGFEPRVRRALYLSTVAGLAAIHAVDLEAAGLAGLGPPSGYLERQIRRWTRQYEASRTDDLEAMNALARWLPEHLPTSGRTALVHGDYRIGNLVFARDTARLVGVLDWELATLGDPFADLAYLCMGYHHEGPGRPGLIPYPGDASGVPRESELLEEYCRLAGIGEIPHWRFYLAFSFFRLAAILQGVYRRGLDGNAASREALSKRELVRVCAETGWRLGS